MQKMLCNAVVLCLQTFRQKLKCWNTIVLHRATRSKQNLPWKYVLDALVLPEKFDSDANKNTSQSYCPAWKTFVLFQMYPAKKIAFCVLFFQGFIENAFGVAVTAKKNCPARLVDCGKLLFSYKDLLCGIEAKKVVRTAVFAQTIKNTTFARQKQTVAPG